METRVAQSLQLPTLIDSEKAVRRSNGSVHFSRRFKEQKKLQVLVSTQPPISGSSNRQRNIALEVSCSFKKFPGSVLDSGGYRAPLDEGLILKSNSEEIQPYLSGRCIYLVGMMGSGKTTVGKVLSQVLGYSFHDSDALIEQEVGRTSVSEIFKLYGEGFFRDKETEVLRKLSLMNRLVVSTGGGAVVRPINWSYMWKGVSVWLDVPVKALAQRIALVGTGSRPLLPHESGDVYEKTYTRLSSIYEERSKAYANANARVSLENIAAKCGQRDLSNLTPTAIAIEALEQINDYLKKENGQIAF